MCGIYGTSVLNKFEVFYEANRERGTFATGFVALKEWDQQILKQEGIVDLNKVKLDSDCDYYLGHSQAPTSANRKWTYETSHPFESEDWLVFHNGVLTNDRYLRQINQFNHGSSPVDTQTIVALLQQQYDKHKTDKSTYEIIKDVCEQIEGTFALAIVFIPDNEIYILRQGSALFFNKSGEYSSIQGKNMTPVPEGNIYKLIKRSHWRKVATFKSRSPFLFV